VKQRTGNEMVYPTKVVRSFRLLLAIVVFGVSVMTEAEQNSLMTQVTKPPIVIAHRGASGYLPEHTLLAVTAAHVMGADYIEQDIVLSADGVPVVLHDIYLDATTDVATQFPNRARSDGRYYAIDFTLSELKSLTVTERRDRLGNAVFAGRFPLTDLSLRIPSLAEEIELIAGLNRSRGRTAGLYIELKAPVFHTKEGHDIAAALMTVLDDHGVNEADTPVILQCFHDGTLRRLRSEFGVKLPLIQLLAENSWGEDGDVDYNWLRTAEGLDAIAEYANGIGPWLPHLLEEAQLAPNALAQMAHDRGLLVHPYTLRADSIELGDISFEHLQKLIFIEVGADGAFTDFPDLTRRFIDSHFQSNTPK